MTKKTIVVEADLLSELASDLEDYLRLTYDTTYPSEARRFERDMEPVNRARELLKEQPPEVQVEPDPCLDRFALDLMQRIWAIGDMDTPVSQRKAQIQVELIESLEPFYSGRNKQTIDTGKVREILAEMANKVSFFWGYGSNANKCYELADEYADQIASLVGCEQEPIPCSERLQQLESFVEYVAMTIDSHDTPQVVLDEIHVEAQELVDKRPPAPGGGE